MVLMYPTMDISSPVSGTRSGLEEGDVEERMGMPVDVEIRDNTWDELDDVATARDTTVSALADRILSRWLEKHYESIMAKAEEQPEAEQDSEE
jgi:predicted DNA-binding ribbon-helix-helix protein